ncbi:lipoyl(octanoyl) transferase [Boudabousia tangfeifanii]|uniref:Octanoyltransferase n=1 Tax=Boudabousia tangfeifanii TaxID=1912795 RepID=A0A1D9MM52_9ACTO|nr:lipoyl(octanoyl) transferase [Boudabousia tangfeifanii]
MNLLPLGPTNYQEVFDLQHQIHAEVASGKRDHTLILVEHEPSYTAGRRTQPEDIVNPNIPVYQADRGGRVTYHGPGQLVIYPILRFTPPADVVKYVRTLEQAIRKALKTAFNLDTITVEGRSGVWLSADPETGKWERKICAIGVKFARDTTLHGLALNVTTDLNEFSQIVPCGIADAGVTSLQAEGVNTDLTTAAQALVTPIHEMLSPLLDQPGDLGQLENESQVTLSELLAQTKQ